MLFTAGMQVHVSLHDVSPAWEDEIERALELCYEAGARPALLVVPNFHGRASLDDHPAFCARLRELQAMGHEVYLHGFYHQANVAGDDDETVPSSYRDVARPSLWSRARRTFDQKIVSAGEAEFRDVSAAEGKRRLEEGQAMLERAGLRIDGFIAPAWSFAPWLLPLLSDRGYRFTEDHLRIYDPLKETSRPSVVLNYASRSPARILSTVAWNRLAKHARAVMPARIAIHPADMNFNLLRQETERLLDWAGGHFAARGTELFS